MHAVYTSLVGLGPNVRRRNDHDSAVKVWMKEADLVYGLNVWWKSMVVDTFRMTPEVCHLLWCRNYGTWRFNIFLLEAMHILSTENFKYTFISW